MTRRTGHGRVLRLIRQRLGWPAKRLGREPLLSQESVYGMERGRHRPSAEALQDYAVLARRAGLGVVADVLEAVR